MTLTKQKQIALLKLGGVTALVLVALWFFLVHSAQTRLDQKKNASADLVKLMAAKKQVIQRSNETAQELKESSRELRAIENQMVTGDIYLWIEKTLRDFEIPDQIEFTKYDPPQIVETEVPSKLPYKIAAFSVSGSATYHDLGTFLANFENSYPHIRIRRLEMEPAAVGADTKNERLTFFMEMQALVHPSNSVGSKPRT